MFFIIFNSMSIRQFPAGALNLPSIYSVIKYIEIYFYLIPIIRLNPFFVNKYYIYLY